MLELLLCSLLTILPDYLIRRYVQGKRLGREITFYSVWYELSGCLETFGEGGWPGRGVIPDGCRSQSGQFHVDPGHPSAA